MIDLFIREDQPCVSTLSNNSNIKLHLLPINGNRNDSATIKRIAQEASVNPIAIYNSENEFRPGYNWVKRIENLMSDTSIAMIYSDYRKIDAKGNSLANPTIEYQIGSVRDDFDFGPLTIWNAEIFKSAADTMSDDIQFNALYEIRLIASTKGKIFHLGEMLYETAEPDNRTSGEKQFDYVNPANRAYQIEMEETFTRHLKRINGFIGNDRLTPDFSGDFPVEASVIIPVRNRVKTISQAIESAATQVTNFPFNVIVIDNHSTDGTSEEIERTKAKFFNVVHIIPERHDLGIGGCWNLGINDSNCGRFSVQLDSDDLYSSTNTLQAIYDKFIEEKCAMVIGSYSLTDFNLQPIPPGLIDHKEWTDSNGRNNALRINGLGAPRAFLTNILREIGIPNVSYGEDYALGLRISRDYHIGRIYESLYLCRRWEGNSDSNLDISRVNANNRYKDTLRSIELSQRIQLNSKH